MADRWSTVLAGFDDEALAKLLGARPDLASPPPDDLAELATRAGTWGSVYACYRGLDRWCQQVVQALCLLDQVTTVANLTAVLGPDAEVADVERAVAQLGDRALVLPDGDNGVELVPALAELPFPGGLGPPAESVLATHTGGQLIEMARRLGVRPGTTKTATLAAVASALSDPASLPGLIESGPPGIAAVMGEILDHGPEVMVPGAYQGRPFSDRSPVGWLMNRGVLAPVSWNRAVMPGEAGLALRGGRLFPVLANCRPELSTSVVGTEVVDGAGAQVGLRLVADIITVLDGWATDAPTPLKAGGLGIRDVRRAAKVTGRTDVEVARIVDLAAAAGLVEVVRPASAILPTAAYDDWLTLDPAQRWTRLAAAWWAWPFHLGLAGAIGTKDKPIPPLLDRMPEPDAVRRRHAVFDVLAGTAPGASIDSAALRARLDWETPLLWSGGPARPSMLIDWVSQEADLVGLCSHGALTSAGRLVAGGHVDDAAAALAPYAPPVSSAFVVQADLTVVAPGELAPPVRAELDLIADVESKGSATVYRLSESSIRRGFEAGRTADDIVAFLESHATRAIPQSLAYLVADLGRRFAQVRVGAARCYVRSDDASLLAEVCRSRRTAKLGLRLLAPTVATAEADPAAVLAALQAAGYLPAPEDADGALVLTRPAPRRAPPRPTRHAAGTRGAAFDERMARYRGGPVPASPSLDDGELLALAARLRTAPASSPSPSDTDPDAGTGPARPRPPVPGAQGGSGRRFPPAPPSPAGPVPQGIFDDELRPLEIVKGRAAIELLLARAYVEDWAVRLAYVNGNGRSSQLNVVVLDGPDDEVAVECFPAGDDRVLAVDRIEWARVMTDAEEELLW